MDIKSYFAQDDYGNIIPGAVVSILYPGTTNLVPSIKSASGADLSNPFTSGMNGLIQFCAPPGTFDMKVESGGTSFTLRFNSLSAIIDRRFVEEKKPASGLGPYTLAFTPDDYFIQVIGDGAFDLGSDKFSRSGKSVTLTGITPSNFEQFTFRYTTQEPA